MQIQFKKPEVERFLDEEVRCGHFESRDAAIEAAVELMMQDQLEELDDETVEAINLGMDQIDRGETVDFHAFAAELRKKFVQNP